MCLCRNSVVFSISVKGRVRRTVDVEVRLASVIVDIKDNAFSALFVPCRRIMGWTRLCASTCLFRCVSST